MKGFLAIFRREFAERRQILYAAAFASLIPFLLPAFRSLSTADVASLRGGSALLIAAAFALGLPAALGVSAIVPRIVSRRIGFDLARPISGTAIWFGTLAATASLAIASALIIGVPGWFAGGKAACKDLLNEPAAPSFVLSLLLVLPGIFGLFHALAVGLRSRSARIALDAVAASAAVVGARAALFRLPFYTASDPWIATLVGMTCAGGLALVVAGCASVARGRAELRAAHRALSAVLWTIVFIAVLAANSYTIWVLAAGPGTLAGSSWLWVRPASSGPWVQLSGRARGADATFLYNTANKDFARVETPDWRGPAFSRDGRHAAWIEGTGREGPHPVRTLRLDEANARPVTTRLILEKHPFFMELSTDGSRLATWEDGVLAIHDLEAQRTLMTAKLVADDREVLSGSFVDRSIFRLRRISEREIDILEANTSSRTITQRARIEGFENLRYAAANSDGGRIATVDALQNVALYDGVTGLRIATLADAPADGRSPRFLPDGRLVVSERRAQNRRLQIFSHDGVFLRSIVLPEAAVLQIGGEVAPGWLCLGLSELSLLQTYDHALWLVGLDDGSVRKVADELTPISLRLAIPEVGTEATKLFYGPEQRSLVRFDPLTGERRTLLGKP